MEQSHSPSDVLSGLRENPSALMSARLSVKWRAPPPPPPPPQPSVDGDVGEEWTPADCPGGERRAAAGGAGGRVFLGRLKGQRGSRGAAAAALIRHSDSAD